MLLINEQIFGILASRSPLAMREKKYKLVETRSMVSIQDWELALLACFSRCM
jgi:hypothetical protein